MLDSSLYKYYLVDKYKYEWVYNDIFDFKYIVIDGKMYNILENQIIDVNYIYNQTKTYITIYNDEIYGDIFPLEDDYYFIIFSKKIENIDSNIVYNVGVLCDQIDTLNYVLTTINKNNIDTILNYETE